MPAWPRSVPGARAPVCVAGVRDSAAAPEEVVAVGTTSVAAPLTHCHTSGR